MLAYTPRSYSYSLVMRPAVSYIPYATSSDEKTGNILNFVQSEDGSLVENGHNAEEYESTPASIDQSYTDNESDDGYISTKDLEEIWDVIQIHPGINARDARFKIRDCIKRAYSEWKIA